MSETIYQLNAQVEQAIALGFVVDEETGEVLYDESNIEELGLKHAEKLEACAMYIINQEALAKSIKEQEQKLASRRKAIENRVERLKGSILEGLMITEGQKLETPTVKLTTRKSTRSVIDDIEKLPEDFVEEITTKKVNSAGILKALRAGETIEGAHLEERKSLKIS